MAAVEERSCAIAEFLISRGGNLDLQDGGGYTPLMHAVCKNRVDTVKLLLSKGANPNYCNKAQSVLDIAVKKGNRKIINLLLEHGAKINQQDNKGGTPIYQAIRKKQIEIVCLLLARGANPFIRTYFGGTTLMTAAFSGDRDLFDLILSQGVDPDMQNKHGWTALMFAARHGYKSIVESLLMREVKSDLKNHNGKTAAILAKEGDHEDIYKMIKRYDGNWLRKLKYMFAKPTVEEEYDFSNQAQTVEAE
ncbi:ankyrin repeat domain-containing protein [Spartinivicinus ruber]|uniref:ankyrin repeat domain-containing protein n=1 Tax=Spartinivicinus ruber TaxID=2683272 RepID=UPI0013D57485|nr:ankyrin repeat domain-containing protein [Spartinivicinus ruber]